MKKILSITIAFVMALTVFAVTPNIKGAAFASAVLKAKTTAVVYVRSKAGTSGKVLATFSKGKKFTVKGAAKDSSGTYWYKLSYNSKTGYICSKYAVRTGLSTTTITKTTGTVTSSNINLRLGPGTDYTAVARAPKGYKLNVNGTAKDTSGKKWYRVYSSDGFKLYISGTYLKLAGTNSSSAGTTSTSSSTLTMKGKTKDKVNVRAGAGTGKKIKGTLAKGKTVTITGMKKAADGSYWYIIKYKSGKGYVSATYVSRKGYTTSSMAATDGTITGSSVNLRLGPGTTYPIYTTAKKGKVYSVTGKSTDSSGYVWYRLKVNSKLVLYVGSNYITLEDDEEQESSENVITASDVTYPTTLANGNKFTLKGTLTSSYSIEKVIIGITDTSGSWLSGYKVTETPDAKTFDISNVDADIKFGSLSVGTYCYKCMGTTSKGKETVFSYQFTVQAAAGIKLSGVTYPKEGQKQYKSFTLKGTIKCDQTMTKIVIGIAKSNGSWLSGHYVTRKPNSTTYDISNVDSKIKFGDLSVGSYIYRCYVTTETGKQTAFSYSFTIIKNTGIPATKSYGTLSGDQRKDIVTVAMAQVGYTTNSENHTAYNVWYYGSNTQAAWCAIFVSWCADRAGVSTGVIPKMAYVPSITSWYKNKSRFNAKKTLPKAGDLIIYAGSAHIGIVAADVTSTSGKVSTIEGNTGNDEVKYRKNYMKWNSSAIQGYCRPNYK